LVSIHAILLLDMEKHKPQSVPSAFWPVTFPLLVGAAAVIALLVWAAAASAGGSDLSRFADLSAVLLIILMMVLSVVPLLLLGGIAYGLLRLYRIIPRGTRQLQQILEKVETAVKKAASVVTEPMIRVKSAAAGIKEPISHPSRKAGKRTDGERIELEVKKGDQDD